MCFVVCLCMICGGVVLCLHNVCVMCVVYVVCKNVCTVIVHDASVTV